MKYKKIILTYLLSSFVPPIVLLVNGFIAEPEDCNQCKLLLIVGSGIVLVRLLLIHAVQFFALIRLKNVFLDFVLLTFCAFSSSMVLAVYLLDDIIRTGKVQADWQILLAPSIANLLMGFFTFWIFLRMRSASAKD